MDGWEIQFPDLTEQQMLSVIAWGIHNSNSQTSMDYKQTCDVFNHSECINAILVDCWKYNRINVCNRARDVIFNNIKSILFFIIMTLLISSSYIFN